MARRDIVVIGASIGGVEALSVLVGGLPAGLGAAVFVSLSLDEDALRYLPDVLGRVGPLPVGHPVDGDEVLAGRIHVAPPGRQMRLEGGRVLLTRTPARRSGREVDELFGSAALAYGARVVGVILTGWDGDGATGLAAIGQAGGAGIVQDPREAAVPSMPLSALASAGAEILPVQAIAARLAALSLDEE